MVLLVLVVIAGTGAFVHWGLYAATLRIGYNRENTRTQLLSSQMEQYLNMVEADVRSIANSPLVRQLAAQAASDDVAESQLGAKQLRALLNEDFFARISAIPAYAQIRLIGLADGGREIIRVDRLSPGGQPTIVPESKLQKKAARPYFQNAIAVGSGKVYVSPIELNQEHGAIETPHVPVIRVASPINAPVGHAFAVVVINVDMRPIFNDLRARMADGESLYIANAKGDFLVHPRRDREFGFELGHRYRVDDEFPSLPTDTVGIGDPFTHRLDDGRGQVVVSRSVDLPEGRRLQIVVAKDKSAIMAPFSTILESVVAAAIPAVLASLLIAYLVSRSMAGPIHRFAESLAHYQAGDAVAIPRAGGREFAMLAAAFKKMASEVSANAASLKREIAERTRAEESFRRTIEASPSGMIVIDQTGQIQMVNARTEQLFGYERAQLVGQPVEMLIPKALRERHVAERDRYFENPVARQMGEGRELLGRRRDSSTFPVEIGLSPIRAPGGTIVLSTIVDITSRRIAERQMRHLQAIVTHSDDAIISKDLSGIITSWNAGADRLYGYTADQMLGRHISELAASVETDEQSAVLERVRRGEAVRAYRTIRRRKDGVLIEVSLSVSPILNDAGDIVGASAIARDITEQVEAERQLERSNAELTASNRELEQFAYVVSHDLKAPLRGIASVAEWLAEDFGKIADESSLENIELMLERTDRLSKLIDGILEYSRVGRTELTRTTIDVHRLVNGTIDAIDPPENIDVRVEGDLPEVNYDEAQLRQVFQNLISNAIKHLDKPAGEVVVSARKSEDAWAFSVKDNGVGISQRYADRIFELFQTLKPKDVSKSTGVGLAIVKRIVERNGGKVRLVSEEGQGAEFLFTVPIRAAPVSSPQEAHTI